MTSPNTIIADISADIATLEQENRQVRARLERVEKERDELIESVEILIIGACAVGVQHRGERKVLQEAVEHGRATVKKVNGGS